MMTDESQVYSLNIKLFHLKSDLLQAIQDNQWAQVLVLLQAVDGLESAEVVLDLYPHLTNTQRQKLKIFVRNKNNQGQ